MKEKKISVCIATYNGEKYIREQLESILKQLKETDEVIVSDDGSRDATLDVIRSFHDDRITVVENELEHGYTKNFENALSKAAGDIIFISDQDDVWMDDKVKVMCEALKTCELAVHDASMTDSDLNVTVPSHFKRFNIKPGFFRTLLYTRYTGACMAMRREFLELALPFPKDQILCPYDYWFAYLGEYTGKIRVLNIPLIYYRRHENTALHAGEYSTRTFYEKLMTRVYCINAMHRRLKERR